MTCVQEQKADKQKRRSLPLAQGSMTSQGSDVAFTSMPQVEPAATPG